MNLDKAFGIHPQALKLWEQRTETLANNIANGDTPGFKAKDLDFKSILNETQGLGGSSMHRTQMGHMESGQSLPDFLAKERQGVESRIDGNTVDLQKEKTAFAENAMRYQASLNFLDGSVKSLLLAIKGQ